MSIFSLALTVVVFAIPISANEPRSGRKGGISSCQEDTFICNDGPVSTSKKSCVAYMGSIGLFGRRLQYEPHSRQHMCVEQELSVSDHGVYGFASRMTAEKATSSARPYLRRTARVSFGDRMET